MRPALSLLFLSGCFLATAWAEEPLQRFEQSQTHMGTTFRIVFYAPDASAASRAAEVAFSEIRRLDALLSDYQDNSLVSRINAQAGQMPLVGDPELLDLLESAKFLTDRTDGAFDITVGAVVRQWRRARRRHQLPTPEHIASARAKIGVDKLEIDRVAGTIRLVERGVFLDLGGIAKGYACDRALESLREQGISRAMVVGGGDIALGDAPPGTAGWRIRIDPIQPDPPGSRPRGSQLPELILTNGGVSTSGDNEQFIEVDGRRYSHIVDPRTGLGLTDRLHVTVVAPCARDSDSLATACRVLGVDAGLRLIEETPRTECLFQSIEESAPRLRTSSTWAESYSGTDRSTVAGPSGE